MKKRGDSLLNKVVKVEKYINRPLGSLIVRMVFKTRITPNGLTYCNFILGLLAAFLFTRGEYLYFVLGGISIQLSAIVDCADGQLARAKDMCSEFGSHLDIFLDRITDFCLILGIAVGLYYYHGDINYLIVGSLTAGLYLLQINLFYIYNSYNKVEEKGSTGESRALLLLLILGFSIANRLDIILYLLLAETLIASITRTVLFIRLGYGKKES
ncbi:MAG: CDP-alcohol phosphatidyltransferase family protein [bacterium]|nr:CDP-alcohol phosphatidyltransferase family protein [bacterium]